MAAITPSDLRDTARLLILRDEMVAEGELKGECSPELFVAIAEVALERGKQPVALFVGF